MGVNGNEWLGPAAEPEHRGIDTRHRGEGETRKPSDDYDIEPGAPEDTAKRSRPQRSVLRREFPLHDDLGLVQAGSGISQEAVQNRA